MTQQNIDGNVASRLRIVTAIAPGAIAIAQPAGPPAPDGQRNYRLTTFQGLNDRSESIARGLAKWGLRPGMRIVMLVPFSAQFIELAFALLLSLIHI